jgi:AcrR family transcriptional regulator
MTADARPSQSRRRGPEPRFTRAEIFEAALRLIDRHGREALTMRRLAQELGIGTMTLYGYVSTREELLDGVGGILLHRLAHDVDSTETWDQQLIRAINELHAVLRAHPGAIELLTAQALPGPALDAIRETLLAILIRAGLDNTTAAETLGALVSYAVGFALTARGRSGTHAANEAKRLRGLPNDRYPNLVAIADEYAVHTSREAFDRGLNHLVAGIQPTSDDPTP